MRFSSPARWLLRCTLPADERHQIVCELDEAARAKYPRRGPRSWLWYWNQALNFSARFLLERLRENDRTARAPRIDASHRHAPRTVTRRKEGKMRGFWSDVGFAIRQLASKPGFTAVVVFTLALGIGPNTAIFSVVNGVLLRPLPYDDPEELALVRIDLSGLIAHPGIARGEVADLRERSTLLDAVGAVTRGYMANLTAEGNMEAVLGADVTPNLFPMLGVDPVLGRRFAPDEGVPQDGDQSSPRVAMLSYDLWQRRFGGDSAVIGQTIEINNTTVPIAGVMPEGFNLLLGPGTSLSPDVDLWRPLVIDPDDRGFWAYRTIVRMADGVSLEQARAEVAAIGEQLMADFPDAYENSGIKFYLHPLHNDLVQKVRPAILALSGAVGLVLLIACTNAASLLLARNKAREKEIAVRAALGAARPRIMRQVMTESLVLAMLAGGAGMLLGSLGLDALLAGQPGNLPRVDDIGLDRTVLGFTLAASFLAAMLFGVIPAWQASRPQLQEALKEGRRSGGNVRSRTRSVLVVAEVAFSLMLLIGAGLLIRTFTSLRQVDLGFEPQSVVTMQAPIDGRQFDSQEKRWSIYRQLRERVEALPGVRAAGAISLVPLGNQSFMAAYSSDGSLDTNANWNGISADYRWVVPGYFESMGIGVLAGRAFEDQDNEDVRLVAVVDATLARQAWPDEHPIGKRIQVGTGTPVDDVNEVEVVGVVEHSRSIDVRREVRPQVYLPYTFRTMGNMALTVRAEGDTAALVAAIRREVEDLGTGRPVHTVRTMNAYVDDAMGDTRFTLILMGALAGIALLLSAVGIYSVIAFLVRQRAHETGVRLALGARGSDIVRLSLREGLVLALIGVPIGIAGSLFLTRFIEGLLFGVAATDPTTFVAIPVLLVAVALFASLIPAYRATRVDPLVALREE